MQDHPIPPVSEPYQYRAIGLVRGIYVPSSTNHFNRGRLLDGKGCDIDSVLLGRVIGLIKRHVKLEDPHLWVVYPRTRDKGNLHLQIVGIWEPHVLAKKNINKANTNQISNVLSEGDEYFSIRGELIYVNSEKNDLVIKIRQIPKDSGKKYIPFKLYLKGSITSDYLRQFVSVDVRRIGNELWIESAELVGSTPKKIIE